MFSFFKENKEKRLLRRMGYLTDQEGIINRYLQEKEGWDKHVKRTKQYIVKTLSGKKYNTVGVLGSGWLLDVPMDFLAKNFNSVILYDIVHPPRILHSIKKYKNVKAVSCDITSGAVELFYEFVKKNKHSEKKSLLEGLDLPAMNINPASDFYISVNILNQLDSLIMDYLLNEMQHYTQEETLAVRRKIQEQHLDFLQSHPSCLITDYEELLYDKQGNMLKSAPLVFADIPKGIHSETWKWDFDMSMKYHKGQKTVFNVMAREFGFNIK